MNRADLQQLAELRIAEAKVLLDAGFYAGAYYLAGYAVECGLKACIARLTRQNDFPDRKTVNRSYSHNLSELVDVAQLKTQLDSERQASLAFDTYWNAVKIWSEEARYDVSITATKANELYVAITDPTDGVLPWLKKYW
jgi:HEPN domain-containing protein